MKLFGEKDTQFMGAALALARNVKGSTFPNPAVGAVIVKNGRIAGKGATAACGGAHAEIGALRAAGRRAAGATLYVTLEPCCHYGRTPPCTDAIIHAGIKRVVAALKDPNPRVRGRGLGALRRAGIVVEAGCCEQQAYAMNEDFCFSIVAKRPWISLKLAMTLDGRIADIDGASRWITAPHSRHFVHRLRATHAAIAVGAGTLRADDPRLTVRGIRQCGRGPARIVFADDPATIPVQSNFLRLARKIRTICVMRSSGKTAIVKRPDGLELWQCAGIGRLGRMKSFLRLAYEEGLSSILVEGGSTLASFFLEKGLVSRIYFFYGNKIIGRGLSGLQFQKGLALKKAMTLDEVEIGCFKEDVMVTGIPRYR